MANPLMPSILNNTLIKMGKVKSENRLNSSTYVQTANLSREQEGLLKNSILKPSATRVENQNHGFRQNDNEHMVTLESLRKAKTQNDSSPAGEKSRETVGKSMVSLASIGKVYKK